jgi:tetratricopeptide (TPR) repeat protein
MNHPEPSNLPADPLAVRSRKDLLNDWTGRVKSRALFDVARELYVNEQFEHAAVLFRYLLAFRTRAASVWSWLGACLEAQGKREAAVFVYEAALQAFADNRPGSKGGTSACTPEQHDEFVARIRALRFEQATRSRFRELAP